MRSCACGSGSAGEAASAARGLGSRGGAVGGAVGGTLLASGGVCACCRGVRASAGAARGKRCGCRPLSSTGVAITSGGGNCGGGVHASVLDWACARTRGSEVAGLACAWLSRAFAASALPYSSEYWRPRPAFGDGARVALPAALAACAALREKVPDTPRPPTFEVAAPASASAAGERLRDISFMAVSLGIRRGQVRSGRPGPGPACSDL